MAAVPSVLSPKPPAPESLHVSLMHSAPPKPKVSGCKWNFVFCPFMRLSASSAISPLLFTDGCYLGFFVSGRLWYCRLRSPSCVLDPTLLRGVPGHCNIPPGFQLPPLGAQLALSRLLHTPSQPHCGELASSVCPWL